MIIQSLAPLKDDNETIGDGDGDNTALAPQKDTSLTEDDNGTIDEGDDGNTILGPQKGTSSTAYDVCHKCTFPDVFRDFLLPIISIVPYVFDIGSDIWLVVIYAQSGDWWWCGWTLSFVVITALVLANTSVIFQLFGRVESVLFISNSTKRCFLKTVAIFSLTSPFFSEYTSYNSIFFKSSVLKSCRWCISLYRLRACISLCNESIAPVAKWYVWEISIYLINYKVSTYWSVLIVIHSR